MSPSTSRAQELAGQSIFFRFMGPAFTPAAREAFRQIRPAGVLFFADNLTSREQITALTAGLQAEAASLGMPPLFISADQEGGIVSRFPPDMVTVPGAMAIGQLPEDDIREMARITARQLLDVGINLNFAPTVDVNNNPANPVIRTRSFGETPEVVSRAAIAAIRGHLDEGVIPTLKHFPGHGDTHIDSHLGLPVIDHPIERLRAVELAPFQAAIDAGAPAVMSAHIVFPALDEHPATLSHRILTGLLRDEMGFRGVIFTDSMSMDAISQRYGVADGTVRAKAAGVDCLESNETPEQILARHEALVHAIEDGTLPLERFEATEQRLSALRERFSIGASRNVAAADGSMRDRAREVAARTIRTVGDTTFAALDAGKTTVIVDFQRLRASEAEDPFNRAGIIRDGMTKKRPGIRVVTFTHDPDAAQVRHAQAALDGAETLVLMTRDATENAYQIDIAKDLIARANPERIVHVALRGPYDAGILDGAGDVADTLLTFGDPAVTLEALVDRLVGGSSRRSIQ
jgi:beta-N-acetylhexosaminidase